MIVDSMTHTEVYQELERDRDAVTRWWGHQLEAQRRRALKSARFPLRMWFEYISPRRNRYTMFIRILDKRMRHVLTGVAVLHRTSEGMAVYTTWLGYQKNISPMVILPHAWKRYAERCHVDKTGIDLIRHYFEYNAIGKDSKNQKVVGRSVRWNGKNHLSNCVPEGIMLGQLQDDIFIARTFITYDMTCGRQHDEFEARRKEIMTDMEWYKEASSRLW